MATTKGIYTTNRTYVALLRGTYAYVETYLTDPFFMYNSLLLSGDGSNDAQNNTFLDSSTNTFTITRNGNTTQGTFSPYGGNWSIFAPATGSYVSGSNSIFNISSTTVVWTYESWVMPLTNTSFFAIGSGGSYGNSIYIGWATNKFTVGGGNGAGSNPVTFQTTGTYPAGAWYHVAVTRTSAGVYTLYINGVADGTQTYNAGTLATGTTFVINGVYDNNGLGNSGGSFYVSNMRFLVGTALYTGNFTVPTAPLTAITNTAVLTGQDNRFIDDSPNNLTLTPAGSVSVQRFSPFSPIITTPTTYSASFDGTGDYLTVPYNSALNLGSSTTWTMEYWVYFNAAFGTYTPISFLESGALRWNMEHGAASTNFIFNNSTAVTFTHPSTLTPYIWYHIAWVRDGTTVRMYINGVVSSTTSTNNLQSISSGPLSIGYNAVGSGYEFYMNGYISNLRLVKGTAVYTANFTPSTTPLTTITNTSLLTCQSPTFIDNSTNNFTITAFGNSKPTTVNPFGFTNTASIYSPSTFGGSSYFDGDGDWLTTPTSSNLGMGSGDFTIECWVYATNPTYTQGFFHINATAIAGTTAGYAIGITSAGVIQYYAGSTFTNTSSTITANTWTHLALVRSSGTVKVYVNGILPTSGGSIADSQNVTSALAYIALFYSTPGTSYVMTGYISNFRVVKGTAIYTSNFVPPVAPVTAVTNTQLLCNFTNAAVTDSSMMINLETVADSKISTTQSKFGGSSIYFDGTGDYLAYTGGTSLNFGTGDFTIELWAYLANNGTFNPFIRPDASGSFVEFGYDFSTGQLKFQARDAAIVAVTTSMPTNQWTHVAACRSGTSLRLFINGTQVGSTTTNSTNFGLPTGTIRIGSSSFSGSHVISGYIDDFRVTKYARYTSNFTPINSSHPLR